MPEPLSPCFPPAPAPDTTGSLRLHNQRIESQLTHDNPCPTKPSAAFTREQSALYSSMPSPHPCEVTLHLNQLALVTHL